MDILAHMLWTNYGNRRANKLLEKKKKSPINIWWTTFWGVFPDLFAFGIPLIIAIFLFMFNGDFSVFPSIHGSASDGLSMNLYHFSHSLIIWVFVFGIVWFIFKHPRLELLGWLLHILIDIPSHAADFYPTPFLFPISNYHFTHGISWRNPWFMIINYSLLIIVSICFYISKKNRKKEVI
jgi:hypothetical protein